MSDISTDTYIIAFLLTLFAGLSTSIGATIAFFEKCRSNNFLSFGLGFSAGIMIYVSFMEILIKSMDSFTLMYDSAVYGKSIALLCFFIGILICAYIDKLLPSQEITHPKHNHSSSVQLLKSYQNSLNREKLRRTGIFTAIAIGVHNFPEGFATFISALNNITIGIPIALAIALHNIPEGMAVSIPIYHSTKSKKKAFCYATLSGLAEPIGAVIGYLILLPLMGDATLGITFGIVAGLMIYISFDELLPSARVYGNDHISMIGLVMGMLVMASSLILFEAI